MTEAQKERAAVVAWLRGKSAHFLRYSAKHPKGSQYHIDAGIEIEIAAQDIERGEHKK